jgi:tetrapyrrole (corrin/porphyrin) methylase-like protein
VPGSLAVVGTGIAIAAHLTPEARAEIDAAEEFLHVAAEPLASEWLDGLHPRSRSLVSLYDTADTRLEVYDRMAAEIVAPARAGRRVCAAFYGNPAMFARPAHEAVRRARREGIRVKMLPAVSAVDCLVVDLGVDPGDHGWLSYEATDFLLHGRPFDAACALVLWQIGVIGELGPVTDASLGHLGLVADRLAAVHGADHEVVVYEASPYPIAAPLIERVPIRDLAAARVTPLATLYVPPSASPAVDESVAARLGLAPASR